MATEKKKGTTTNVVVKVNEEVISKLFDIAVKHLNNKAKALKLMNSTLGLTTSQSTKFEELRLDNSVIEIVPNISKSSALRKVRNTLKGVDDTTLIELLNTLLEKTPKEFSKYLDGLGLSSYYSPKYLGVILSDTTTQSGKGLLRVLRPLGKGGKHGLQ